MYGAGSRIEVTSVLGMNTVALVFFGCINVGTTFSMLVQQHVQIRHGLDIPPPMPIDTLRPPLLYCP